MRIVFYVLGSFCAATGLFFLLRPVPDGCQSGQLAYSLLAVMGPVLFAIGGAWGWNRRLVAIASVVALAATSTTVWAMITTKSPPRANDVTVAGSLAYLRPWLLGIGYSPADAETFQVTNIVRFDEDAWPTYAFYFTGTKNGKPQGALGVGNGCGIGELQESEPLTITKM